jgi:hypothetical protein
MKKLAVEVPNFPGNYYKASGLDLSQVALAVDNSAGGICWKLTLNSGKELQVRPADNHYGYTFSKLLADIERAKIYARTLIKPDDAQQEIEDAHRYGEDD